jgi:uncharacterized membrane protein
VARSGGIASQTSSPDLDEEATVESPIQGRLDPVALGRTVELLGMSLKARRAPLPDHQEMAGFKSVQADLPDRIVNQWERETQHRHDLERQIVEANVTNRARGQFIGAYLATLVVVVGAVLIILNRQVAGLATLLPGIGLLVGRFVVHEIRGRAKTTEPDDTEPESPEDDDSSSD